MSTRPESVTRALLNVITEWSERLERGHSAKEIVPKMQAVVKQFSSPALPESTPESPQHLPNVPEALRAAVNALYFDDSSDFAAELWNVVRHLDPVCADLLESNEHAAYKRANPDDTDDDDFLPPPGAGA